MERTEDTSPQGNSKPPQQVCMQVPFYRAPSLVSYAPLDLSFVRHIGSGGHGDVHEYKVGDIEAQKFRRQGVNGLCVKTETMPFMDAAPEKVDMYCYATYLSMKQRLGGGTFRDAPVILPMAMTVTTQLLMPMHAGNTLQSEIDSPLWRDQMALVSEDPNEFTTLFWKAAKDLGEPFRWCHERRMIFIDGKPDNTQVSAEDPTIKFLDLSSCVVVPDGAKLPLMVKDYLFTKKYACPVARESKKISYKTDSFSLGVMLLETLRWNALFSPDGTLSRSDTLGKICEKLKPDAAACLRSLLNEEPDARLSVTELLSRNELRAIDLDSFARYLISVTSRIASTTVTRQVVVGQPALGSPDQTRKDDVDQQLQQGLDDSLAEDFTIGRSNAGADGSTGMYYSFDVDASVETTRYGSVPSQLHSHGVNKKKFDTDTSKEDINPLGNHPEYSELGEVQQDFGRLSISDADKTKILHYNFDMAEGAPFTQRPPPPGRPTRPIFSGPDMAGIPPQPAQQFLPREGHFETARFGMFESADSANPSHTGQSAATSSSSSSASTTTPSPADLFALYKAVREGDFNVIKVSPHVESSSKEAWEKIDYHLRTNPDELRAIVKSTGETSSIFNESDERELPRLQKYLSCKKRRSEVLWQCFRSVRAAMRIVQKAQQKYPSDTNEQASYVQKLRVVKEEARMYAAEVFAQGAFVADEKPPGPTTGNIVRLMFDMLKHFEFIHSKSGTKIKTKQ
eukprot:TRINITY_DN2474_c0_g2_i1.p1 TRINITY_DN2474_c0_g2~~TRINITY_DN2474_c0_g2_i1.p1  ORF type:complete len:738 (+),score=125.99 TRINITY_DN2474_c0_g2_i1:199-2412(+)